MPRVQHKYHYIYKTTNLKNGKYYVGMHSTSNLEDGYLGSGDRVRRSIRKYGKDNFKLEILEFFDDRESLAKREKEIVNEELLKDSSCMNLVFGGSGGFLSIEACTKGGNVAGLKIKKLWDGYNQTDRDAKCKELSIRQKDFWKKGILKYNNNWIGKKHKEESIQKMKDVKINFGIGEKNSQFGTMWITNGIENKKIKKDSEIPENWYKGMIPSINSLKNLKNYKK